MATPSEYEKQAIREIGEWKKPDLTWFGKAMEMICWPLEKGSNVVMDAPGIGWVIEKSVGGIVSVSNDFAQWTVRPDAIYAEYKERGHDVRSNADIFRLDIIDVDRTIGWLGAKYKGIATLEGTLLGLPGLPGIPPDIIALITLNLRAIGEYATYYGFDITSQHERLFAMNVLGLASSPSDMSKGVAMAQLVRIARDVAKKRAWKDLEKHAFVSIVQHISRALGIRLTKAKLAQIVPISGAAIGGGFNAYYTAKVCDAAYYLYRERFLAEKYGPELIELSVEPAPTLDPEYEQNIEDLSK